MKALDILKRAQELVEAGWCRMQFQVFRDGKNCYCASGALNAAGTLYPTERERAQRFLINAITGTQGGVGDIFVFNDSKTKNDVLKAFDVAISNCKRRKTTKVPLRTAR